MATDEVTLDADEEEVDNPEALKRAVLAERYEQERAAAQEEDALENDEVGNDEAGSGTPSVLHEFLSPSGTVTRVTGVNFRPDIPRTLDDALDAGTIDEVQFELENGTETPWYKWAPHDDTAPLTRIIDYYADGDPSELFNTTVDIAPDSGKRNSIITYPTPYDKHTGHASYALWRRFNAVDAVSDDDITDVALTGYAGTKDLSLGYSPESRGFNGKQLFSIAIILAGLIGALFTLFSAGTIPALVVSVITIAIHFLLGPVVAGEEGPAFWYSPVFFPILFPSKKIVGAVKGALSRLNDRS